MQTVCVGCLELEEMVGMVVMEGLEVQVDLEVEVVVVGVEEATLIQMATHVIMEVGSVDDQVITVPMDFQAPMDPMVNVELMAIPLTMGPFYGW